jgi:hypothetical protein
MRPPEMLLALAISAHKKSLSYLRQLCLILVDATSPQPLPFLCALLGGCNMACDYRGHRLSL